MNILFLSQRVPEPPNKGDKIRSHHLMKRLAARHRVHVACLLDDAAERSWATQAGEWAASVTAHVRTRGESAWRGACAPLAGRPISVGYFHSQALARDVDRMIRTERFDLVLAYCSSMAPYAADFSGPKVLDFVDVDSEKWAQYAARASFPRNLVYRLEHGLLQRYERGLVQEFDRSILISGEERDLLGAFADVSRVDVVNNGVDIAFWKPRETPRREPVPTLVFVGALDYFANADGIEHFARAVFPAVRERVANVRLRIVGRRPGAALRALADLPGVDVVGEVDDVRPELWEAAVAVIPLRIAQGVQNKVLEAMAAGTPVVSSDPALRGIEGEAGRHFLRANTTDEWVSHVRTLTQDPARAAQQAEDARRLVSERYSWDRKAEEYEAVLDRAIAVRREVACETR